MIVAPQVKACNNCSCWLAFVFVLDVCKSVYVRMYDRICLFVLLAVVIDVCLWSSLGLVQQLQLAQPSARPNQGNGA